MQDFKSQEWINGHGPLGGHHANVRKNVSLASVPRDKWRRLDRTEEAVADKFCRGHGALLGLIVTSDGTRDVFLFLPQHLDDGSVDALIQSANPEVDYHFRTIHDPTWRPYESILAKKEDT